MASVNTDALDVGVKPGSTWGVAADMTSGANLIHVSSLSISGAYGEFRPRDIGFSNFIQEITRKELSVDISISADLSYHGQWVQLAALFLGTATGTPTENNAGQSDYFHSLALASVPDKFATLAWKVEDDYVLEAPSWTPTSMSVSHNVNDVGTVTFNGIADKLVLNASATNSAADLDALTYPTYEAAVLCGANHYFQIDDYSTGTALSSADNKEITAYSYSFTRPYTRRHVLRGADTKYTQQPKPNGIVEGSLSFTLSEVNDGAYDGFVDWDANTKKMCEIFFDGDQINAGDNTQFTFQFPSLAPAGSIPDAASIPSANTFVAPTYNFVALDPVAAPAGMAGVTDPFRMTHVTTRDTSYTS